MKYIRSYLIKNPYKTLLSFLIIAYIGYFSIFSVLRYQTFHSSYYDLGIMNQTVYNTFRGRILELTDPVGIDTIKRMAIHNDILLGLLAPFYALYPGPETLLVIQTIVLALGVIPLFLLARAILNSPRLAIILSFAYLMYPPLQRSNIFDFHAVTLSTTLLLCMVYCWFIKRYRLSLFFLVLSLLTKEQVAATAALFGLYTVIDFSSHRVTADMWRKKYALVVFTLSIFWFLVSVWAIIPYFRHADHFAVSRYQEFGDSPGAIIRGILLQPQKILTAVFRISTLKYLFWLLLPLGFTPLFFLSLIFVAAPELMINILSANANMHDIIHHYTAVITPFIFIAAIFGIQFILKRFSWATPKKIIITIIIGSILTSYLKSPLPYSREKNLDAFVSQPEKQAVVSSWKKMLRDENIIVSATDTLAPHFSSRRTIIRFSPLYSYADYVLIFPDEVLHDWFDREESLRAYKLLQQDPKFRQIYFEKNLEVYKKYDIDHYPLL